MKLITIWQRWNVKDKAWEHNHIEDGYSPCDIPMPMFDSQQASWKGSQWKKFFGYQDFNNVVHVTKQETVEER